jgi:hypothetical protein
MIWSRREKWGDDCAELLTTVNFLYLIFWIEIIRILDECFTAEAIGRTSISWLSGNYKVDIKFNTHAVLKDKLFGSLHN